MKLTPAQLDRAAGVMLGAACGDALGVPYEFGPRLSERDVPVMRGGGLGDYAPGEYSDDTQMAVMVAEAALAHDLRKRKGLDMVAAGFLRWQEEGATDIGTQTRHVLSATGRKLAGSPVRASLFPWRRRPLGTGEVMHAVAGELHLSTGHTAGNGSLMRTAPVALRYLTRRAACAQAARAVSALTHADPVAGDSCALWCEGIRHAVLTGRKPDLALSLDLIPAERRGDWKEILRRASACPPPSAFKNNGWCVAALQAAYSAVLPSESYEEAAFSAVRAGNDTDTVAAIAGALAGGIHGARRVPREYLASVHGWPAYGADSLRTLGMRLARLGL